MYSEYPMAIFKLFEKQQQILDQNERKYVILIIM